jgi:hypothetical protein
MMAKMQKMTTTQRMMRMRVAREEDAANLLAEVIIKLVAFLLKLQMTCPIPSLTMRCWMRGTREICRLSTTF